MMSSFKRINKDLLHDKFRMMNIILTIHALVILAAQLVDYLNHSAPDRSFTGGVLMALLVGFVFLATANERVYVSNKYRLLPLKDVTLYLSNMISSLLTYFYLVVGEVIIYLAAIKLFPNPYDNTMFSGFNSVKQYSFKLSILLIFILGIIMVWSGITVLHMVINWITSFLPFGKQNLVKSIVAFIVALVFLTPFKFFTVNILKIVGMNNVGDNFTALKNVMLTGSGMLVFWIVIFTVVNIYFLKNKSETNI